VTMTMQPCCMLGNSARQRHEISTDVERIGFVPAVE